MALVWILVLFILSVLLFLLFAQRREIRSITEQIRNIRSRDTNMLVRSGGAAADDLINEINSLLKEMRETQISCNQKNHALEQMMTNISHDLRTPLTSAMGYIDLLQHASLSETEKERELAIIAKRLTRLEELIGSFFELSQVVSGGKEPGKTQVSLVGVLEEAIVHYYDDYCAQERQVIFQCRKRSIRLLSNENMLLRVFDNLIGNALKHGRGDLTITVEETDGIRICFSNASLSPDMDIEHIFDEFYTTDISRTSGNTGLGLAIAKQFTEMLGGSIQAALDGDMFVITLLWT